MSLAPLPPNEPFLASYVRVLRGKENLSDSIALFPTLEQKALSTPPTLTEFERRQLLNFPDKEEEAENIRSASSGSRDELISLALSNPSSLSDTELGLIKRNFWTKFTSREIQERINSYINRTEEITDRIFHARDAAYLPGEMDLVTAANKELWRRHTQRRDDVQSKIGGSNPPNEAPWLQDLSRKFKEQPDLKTSGYITLIDAEVQKIDPKRLDLFQCTLQGLISQTMLNNGVLRNLLNQTWELFQFNAP